MADASAVANTNLQGVQRYQTHPHGSDIFVLRFKREDGSPMNDFFKFPSTPHLAVLLGVDVRGDKVMSEKERDEFLRHEITVEEKIDGANLGISFDGDGVFCKREILKKGGADKILDSFSETGGCPCTQGKKD